MSIHRSSILEESKEQEIVIVGSDDKEFKRLYEEYRRMPKGQIPFVASPSMRRRVDWFLMSDQK